MEVLTNGLQPLKSYRFFKETHAFSLQKKCAIWKTFSFLKCMLFQKVPIIYRLYLVTKLGSTRYFNRSTIGTGLDQILHNHREDLQLQLQWKF